MRDTQSEFESNGRKRFLFILLLPIIIVFFVMQSMTVLGQDELPKGDGSPVQINAVKTSNSGEVTPGTKVGYTIVISNSGGIEETGMVMTDTLPVEFDIVDGTLTGNITQGFTSLLTVTNDVVTWEGALGGGGEIKIVFDAVLTDTAVIGNIITNTALVTGPSTSLSPFAAIEVVDEYKTFLPIIFKPLKIPTLLSVGMPTSSDSFANYSLLVSWENLNDSALTYELQEATEPTFSNPTAYNAGAAASTSVTHPATTTYKYYYRVRTVHSGSNLHSDWSNVILGYGVYRDSFNDSATGWKMRREDTDDTNNSVSYGDSKLRVKIGGRWDSMIASPLVPTPADWPAYRIRTQVDLGEGIDYLHSYGIVFGGDWNGVTSCPNSNFSSCFNQYYRLNVIWTGSNKPFLVHLKRIDSHDTSNNTDKGVTLMNYKDVSVSDPDGWNDWVIDVYNNGTIKLYANGTKFYEGVDTKYVGGGRYFGTFASTDQYLGTAAFYQYYQVEPLP